jgi:NADH dehydrogenase FAD-containing subunit
VNKRVVLVGAGHGHLYVLKNAAALRRLGAEVAIIAQDDFWYSGMATGMLGGLFPVEADRVDIGGLATRTRAKLHRGTMIGLDRAAREVLLEDGRRIGFDLLSLNLGSVPVPLSGKGRQIYSVKPVRSLVMFRQWIEDEWRKANPAALRVAVVGAGVTGVEIAANLRALSDLHGQGMEITAYNRSEPLKHLPRAAAAALIRHLRSIDVEVRWPAAVTSVGENGVFLNDGTREDCDVVVNATGLVPAGICAWLDLPVDADGALFVDRFLKSTSDDSIFAVGDCIAFEGHALPRAGVYAVRQAPVLLANLCATLAGKPLTPFVPQRHYLSIVGLGRSSALMVRGPLWFKGPPALWLKRWIDQRFVDAYRPVAQR